MNHRRKRLKFNAEHYFDFEKMPTTHVSNLFFFFYQFSTSESFIAELRYSARIKLPVIEKCLGIL